MLDYLLLFGGFVPLIYGANLLVDSASSLAKRLNIPNIVIGLTIVAFGTSAPELTVNILSAVNGESDVVMGNVIGSNIFNVAIILGIAAIIYPLTVKTNTTWIEVPMSFLAAAVALVLANDIFLDGSPSSIISRADGIILLAFFAIFMAYNISMMMKGNSDEETEVKDYSIGKAVLLLIAGAAMLVIGGRLIVTSAVDIATGLGIPSRIIAVTIISVGTSLPELATSVAAARKRNVDIAIGNVVGSNIFNIFLVLGISATIFPVKVSEGANIDLLMNVFIGLLLFMFIFTGKGRKLERWEGIVFVLLYVLYLVGILVFM